MTNSQEKLFNQYINATRFEEILIGDCFNKTLCFTKIDVSEVTVDLSKDALKNFDYAVFFAQVECKSISHEFFHQKNSLAALISCIGLLMCIMFWFRINRIWNEVKIDDKIMDY